jgi:Uma2 family endonuclease
MSTVTLAEMDLEESNAPELMEMETDEALYELVDGQRVEIPAMSKRAGRIATWLAMKLNLFAQPNQLGEAIVEILVQLPLAQDPGRNRRPDISVFCYSHSKKESLEGPDENACGVIPDLAIEVTSPTDRAQNQRKKVLEYFQAGVRCVWVVYPELQIVDVYESPTSVRVFGPDDTLVGDPVLPGFQLRLADLFTPFARPKA